MYLLKFLQSTGLVGLSLSFLGFLTSYLIFKNLFFFIWTGYHSKKQNGKETPLHLIMREIQKSPSLSIQARRYHISHTFNRYLGSVLRDLQILRLISVISPLLGLMGTVIGIMNVFRLMAETPNTDPTQLLSGGIWQALTTTIWGLAVAMPTLIAFYLGNLYLKYLAWRVMDETIV